MSAQSRGLTREECAVVTWVRACVRNNRPIGPNAADALLATIERLSESPVRDRWWWPTEEAERLLDGAP